MGSHLRGNIKEVQDLKASVPKLPLILVSPGWSRWWRVKVSLVIEIEGGEGRGGWVTPIDLCIDTPQYPYFPLVPWSGHSRSRALVARESLTGNRN